MMAQGWVTNSSNLTCHEKNWSKREHTIPPAAGLMAVTAVAPPLLALGGCRHPGAGRPLCLLPVHQVADALGRV